MSQIGLLHVWSDASCQLQDCFDCLQALNLNCIYESNILVLIWYIPDIFHKNDLSSVSSAWMISSLWKLVYTKVHNLGKRYMHWNQQKDSFCQEGIYLEYTWDISLPHIWQVYTRNIPYIRYYADSRWRRFQQMHIKLLLASEMVVCPAVMAASVGFCALCLRKVYDITYDIAYDITVWYIIWYHIW